MGSLVWMANRVVTGWEDGDHDVGEGGGGKEESCHEGRVECAGIPHISYQGICARLGGCES
jgi:hypothetical protein